ncbi:MAG: hypothetical protein ACHP9Z_10345 [Streptosporangiales bacterium]
MLHVRGIVLPEREERSPWIDGGGREGVRARPDRGGLPGLADGAPADLVAFTEDPVAHPDVLHHPGRIILRGQILA